MFMKRYILTLVAAACLSVGASAQRFFNLTAGEVKLDSLLPSFNYQIDLGTDYADSIYSVSIVYPEFIDMNPTDVARYQRISGGAPLPEMPVVDQRLTVARKRGALDVSFVPLVMREGRYQKLVSFMLKVDAQAPATARGQRKAAAAATTAADRYADHSVLASGRWVKISIPETGVYCLSDQLVQKAGFSNPSKVKVYGYGGALQPEILTDEYLRATDDLKEVPTCNVGGRRLFHAVGPVNWPSATERLRKRNNYSSVAYYFLTESDAEPLTVDEQTFRSTATLHPNNYHSLVEPEEYSWYHGGRNLYTKTPLSARTPISYTLASSSPNATLSVAMTYDGYCAASVVVNGQQVGSIVVNAETTGKGVSYFGEKTTYSSVATYTWHFNLSSLNVGENTVELLQTSGITAHMRLDHITLTMDQPKAIDLSAAPEPTVVGQVTNQDRHADGAVDMVIIVPTSQLLRAQAERLKTLHEQKDGISVRVVTADELYNEFSSGTPDANAYRRYLKMFYDRATDESQIPKYLLLFGDGVWDNRMLTSEFKGQNPDNFLLCYESDNSFSNVYCYVSDDYYCLLDDGERIDNNMGKPDVAVGRISARTEAEATIAVDKITDYTNNVNAGAWQNLLCFMGDDGDDNQHMAAADELATLIHGMDHAYNIKKVYWDAYARTTTATGNSYPDVRRLLRQQMRDGALVMNYNGHGSAYCLSHEQVLQLADFGEATSMRLPLWVTASCDIMPFDTHIDNIGEKALFNQKGGAIAFFGTTRTVFMERNLAINRLFMKHLFTQQSDGRYVTMAEAVRRAKCELVEGGGDRTVNKLNYNFLGDPALRLAMPTAKAVIDEINGQPLTGSEPLKLAAGSRAVVKGHIEGQSDFSGVATIIVRDVEETITCKKNSTSTAMTYTDRPSTIYSGSDSVSNGNFVVAFAVPRDISYSDECAQILLYAINNDKTVISHGVEENFVMNGSGEVGLDDTGPSIYCYLNDRSFENGGTVNSTPYFYAELHDVDGINVAGSGIGHDLELIIDNDMAKTYVLNSYFQYNFGDYCSGTVGYSIPALEEGRHKLMLRAWDILNNSSTAELEFVVDPTLQPQLLNIICVRNPAKTNTRFLFTHNRIGSELDVTLEIFDTSGRVLWRRTERGVPQDETYAIDWDLNVGSGNRLHTGLYLYRVLVSSNGSTEASAAQKLIVVGNK